MEWIFFPFALVVILLQVVLLIRIKVSSQSSLKDPLDHLEREQSRLISTLRTDLEGSILALKQELRSDLVLHSDSTRKVLEDSKESVTRSFDRLTDAVGNQLKAGKEDSERSLGQQMESFRSVLNTFKTSLIEQIDLLTKSQKEQAEKVADLTRESAQGSERRMADVWTKLDGRMAELTKTIDAKMENLTTNSTKSADDTQNKLSASVSALGDTVIKFMQGMSEAQKAELNSYSLHIKDLTTNNHKLISELSQRVGQDLNSIREDSSRKLDLIKKAVDDQLQEGLQNRINESFKIVNDSLVQVQKGLGEMQSLATGVGDLKQVLTNVKQRGTWGEVQLKALLEQVLAPDQYIENASINGGRERVEFAVKLPGRGESGNSPVLLPIDAKFPLEDYQRLQAAQDEGNKEEIEQSSKRLKAVILECAKTISQKYIQPPSTTDFGILFLPFEGLFAEVVRQRGLCEELQAKHRILLAGPTTLWSLLNSLQLGFKTLAIQKRTSEVWSTLKEVRTEWIKYVGALDSVEKKFTEASNNFQTLSTRTRVLGRRFEHLELVGPADESEPLAPQLNLSDIAS